MSEQVDIISFCNNPSFLNIKELSISQKAILKNLYVGTDGNENLQLTKEESDWLNHKKNNENDSIH